MIYSKAKLPIICLLLAFTSSYMFGQISSGSISSSSISSSTNLAPASAATFFAARFGLSPERVTGAPYSAEEETERKQTLLDGTNISQKFGKTRFYRDSAGRTRTERELFMGPLRTQVDTSAQRPRTVEIFDPVAGFLYMLESQTKTGRRIAISQPKVRSSVPASTPSSISSGSGPNNLHVAPNAVTQSVRTDMLFPEVKTEPLGTETIEGLLAEGLRNTMTTPVGAEGNDRPISQVCEDWRSPELRVQVLHKCSDPRSGDTVTRLTNISRAEPDPALFQVPEGFTITDDNSGPGPLIRPMLRTTPNVGSTGLPPQ